MELCSSLAVIKTLNQVACRAVSVTFANESGESASLVSDGDAGTLSNANKAPGFS